MSAPLDSQTPALRVGQRVYHAGIAFQEKEILQRRSQKRAKEILASLAWGVGMFGVVGSVATLVLSGELAEIFSLSFWLHEAHPPVALLAASGLLFCYAWYRSAANEDRLFALKGDDRAVGMVGGALASPLWNAAESDARQTLEDAFLLAVRMKHAEVTPTHIFTASISSLRVQTLFARLGVTFDEVRDALRRKLQLTSSGQTAFVVQAQILFVQAGAAAFDAQRPYINALDLCAAAFAQEVFLQELFADHHIDAQAFNHACAWLSMQDLLALRYQEFREAAAFKPTKNMDRAMTAQSTPFLDAVAEDITRKAVFGGVGLTVARDAETTAIFRAIEGGGKSVVLVGEPGVGKMAVIEGIAALMVEEKVPKILQDKRLLRIDLPRIVSAQGGQGAGERLLYALSEAAHARNVVLILEDVHQLVGAGGQGIDLASIVASELSKGYTFALCTTTPSAYAQYVERSVLGSRLERIMVQEPEFDKAMRMVEANVGFIERGVVFTYKAVESAVRLSSKFVADTALPEKALTLLREAGARAKTRGGVPCWATHEDVAVLIEEKTNVPVSAIASDETTKLLSLEEKIRERVVGQEDAVTAVSSAIRRARTSMRSQNRPIANFLFLGPTGVGKTELAKATATVFFGDESRMVRFDMSEYQNKESVARLIGGNGESGLLTEAIRKAPFSLLLLDELEKAHPDLLNVFLQVMDDGRLTDGLGRTVDFTNVILIATSNAGTLYIQDEVAKGTSLAVIKEGLMETELRATYRPEFLNRFDDVIVFHPLTPEDVVAIAYLLSASIAKRLSEKGILLKITDAAVHDLAAMGYDPKFGARPLRRVMQDKIENGLADLLLRGSVAPRDTVVVEKGAVLRVEKAQAL
jgi:ATP-dependent Clp protease ATP-binding subunit ClpA